MVISSVRKQIEFFYLGSSDNHSMYSQNSSHKNITMAGCQTSGSDTTLLRASACPIEKEYEWVVSVVIDRLHLQSKIRRHNAIYHTSSLGSARFAGLLAFA